MLICRKRVGLLSIPLIFFSFLSNATTLAIPDLLEEKHPTPPLEEEMFSSEVQYIQTSAIVLNVLDKITARVSEIRGNVGQKITFGNLEILPAACYKTPADEKPESAAYLKIIDRTKEKDKIVFAGWMFASSPSLSTLEHPIYDVWVKACTGLEKTSITMSKTDQAPFLEITQKDK